MCISLAIGMVPVKWLRPPQHWGLQSEAQKARKWNWPEWYIAQLGREQVFSIFFQRSQQQLSFHSGGTGMSTSTSILLGLNKMWDINISIPLSLLMRKERIT